MDNECSIAVQDQTNLPLVDVDSALAYWKNYQDLTDRLLDESDYHISENGKLKFKKKSAWRKYATFMNITCKTLTEDITRTDEGRVITAKYEVKATAPNGRSESGIGVCSIWDKSHERMKNGCKGPCDGRKHFDKPEHDIPSTAHTRAKNRAISDLIGAGEVSAEEIDFSKKESVETSTNGKKTPKSANKKMPKSSTIKQEDGSELETPKMDEVKGDKPSRAKKSKVDTIQMTVPNYEKIRDINTELDHILESKGDKDSITDKLIIQNCKSMIKAGTMKHEEFTEIKERLGLHG